MRLSMPRSIIPVLLVLIAAAPPSAFAFDAGMKAGMSAANISGDIPGLGSDFTMRYGFTGGLYFGFKLGDRLSIQPEAIYAQKGAWVKDLTFEVQTPQGTFEGTMDYEFRLWYFEFPILAKYTLRKDSFLRPFLLAGPCASYTQRAIIEISQNIGPYSFGVRDDISGQLKKWDFGAIVGGGLNCSFTGFSVFVEGRYNLGFINMNDTEEDVEVKNRAISVMLGLNIEFSD